MKKTFFTIIFLSLINMCFLTASPEDSIKNQLSELAESAKQISTFEDWYAYKKKLNEFETKLKDSNVDSEQKMLLLYSSNQQKLRVLDRILNALDAQWLSQKSKMSPLSQKEKESLERAEKQSQGLNPYGFTYGPVGEEITKTVEIINKISEAIWTKYTRDAKKNIEDATKRAKDASKSE